MAITKPMKPAQLGKPIADLVGSVLIDEYAAFYTYRNAYNSLRGLGYMKAAEFFKNESADELDHAGKVEAYLTDWNIVPELPLVPPEAIQGRFGDLVSVINQAYTLELALLQKYDLVSAQTFEKDKVTYDFFEQFRAIQVKSVAEYSDLLNQLALIDVSNPLDLLYFEQTYFG